jgi:hypothetical protein
LWLGELVVNLALELDKLFDKAIPDIGLLTFLALLSQF